MKLIIVTIVILQCSLSQALSPDWSLKEGIDTPESVFYDKESDTFFISNIAGKPDEKDGKGWITQVSRDGKVLNKKWAHGIDAPKGIRVYKGTLWVSNINEVISYNLINGELIKKVKIENSKFLNDVATSTDGRVFVSDTFGNKVYEIKDNKAEELFSQIDWEGPNGLLVDGNDLIVAAWGVPNPDFSTKVPGHLFKVNLKTGVKTLITKMPLGNLDGLEKTRKGNFIVSDWVAGKIFRVTKNGTSKTLFSDLKNPADIGLMGNDIIAPLMSDSQIIVKTFKD